MDVKLKAPMLGAVLIGSAAIGAHMGESAIADINPLYFQGAAVHPRERGAAVDAAMMPAQDARFADHYGWAQGQAARLADCGDCAAWSARDRFAAAPVHHAAAETRSEPLPARMDAEAGPGPDFVAEAAPDVERFAYYPIEEEPGGKPDSYVSAEE